jgi:hypothetical protein
MTDFPAGYPPLPLLIHTYTRYGVGLETRYNVGSLTIGVITWPTANLAIYQPFWLPFPYPVRRLFWGNGVTANNMDIGIYTKSGKKLYSSGSTAGSGNSVNQYVTPSPELMLSPGRYYWGLSHSSTGANHLYGTNSPSVAVLRMMGVLQEASALPLPDSMTPVAPTSSILPMIGMTRTPSGF